MKKCILLILIMVLLFNGCLFASTVNEGNKDKNRKFMYSRMNGYLKGLIYTLASRDFYPEQDLDFMSRSTLLYETLKNIETYINKANLNVAKRVNKDWIEHLMKVGVIRGAVISKDGKMYVVGDIKKNLNSNQGFHILDGSLYYCIKNRNSGIGEKFLINSSYLVDYLFSNVMEKSFKNNTIIDSIVIEIPKILKKNSALSTLILYSNSDKNKIDINEFKHKVYRLKYHKKFLEFNKAGFKRYENGVDKGFFIETSRIAYVKRIYFNSDSDLIFLMHYNNKITASYIYPISLLISVLITIFLLVLLIYNILISKRGGKLSMEEMEEREKHRLKLSNNPIEEIDNEVSKIILEESTEEKVEKQTIEAGSIVKGSAENKVIDKKEKKIEELKKDGIIIK